MIDKLHNRGKIYTKVCSEKLVFTNSFKLLYNVFGNRSAILYDLLDDKEKYIGFRSAEAYKYNRIVFCDKNEIWKYKRGHTVHSVRHTNVVNEAPNPERYNIGNSSEIITIGLLIF